MFNAPRPAQRYGASSQLSGSFVGGENPLGASTFGDGLDPWSSTPSPVPPPPSGAFPSGFSSVVGDATVPAIYYRAWDVVDPGNTGETTLNGLTRALQTSSLSASTIDRIVNLVNSRPRVSKFEFIVALALAALAQAGKDISIEQVAALAAQDNLPIPNIDIDAIRTSTLAAPSAFRRPSAGNGPALSATSPAPPYSAEDPWQYSRFPGSSSGAAAGSANGTGGSFSGSGLPKDWWTRQSKVDVTILGQQGFILNRYTVYEITPTNGNPVSRRYSEFVFLWDCLVRRYPFRILPQLPPKRVGADITFLEQRRRGLARFLNFVVNHPIIKEDGLLAVFLSEPSLETWRKQQSISLEEESTSKRVDRVEEMSIPGDLDDKLLHMRGKIGHLIEHWQKICLLTERLGRRREAVAVRNNHALFKRSFLSTYLTHSTSLSAPPSITSSASSMNNVNDAASMTSSMLSPPAMSQSFFGSMPTLPSAPLIGSARPDGAADGGFYASRWADPQADMSRLTLTLNALNELQEHCWRGDSCELCAGVRQGLGHVSTHISRQSDEQEQRARVMLDSTLEAAKTQRDLYIAMRDLFIRHDKLSVDQVEKLKKRIETHQMKLEGIRAAQKEGWEAEYEKIQSMIEKDTATIQAQLNRRVFIRACMWHELRVVLHNRENTLVSLAVQQFAKDELAFSEAIVSNWQSLADEVETMPYEL